MDSMAMNKTAQGMMTAGQVPVSASPFDRLADAVSSLENVATFADVLADRLAGSQPQDTAGAKGMGVIAGGGLIDGMERQTSAILGIAASIRDSLQRIESRL